ncbi:hypothetical protein [Aliivibrio fischeri]|uniref:hypothetical protein n=1 Tax=Aliivibrio fischeri TaxID=668 RepID=UPI00080E3329|nr:hypothetical protein [Aliivibrio fischeri]OCH05477.1 hypothetical protein A6E11_18005 [Aliivibrio fischeri]
MNKSIIVLTTLVSLVSCKNGDTDLMPSRPTDPTSNHAPQVLDEQIIGNIADKQLELTGTYYDEEGDEPDVEQFTFRWLKDGVDIPGADDYILPVSDASSLLGVTVSGCVTPSAKTGELIGDEYCTDLSIGLSSDISAEVSIDSSVFPLPGKTISASYTYDDNGAGIPEGKSIFGFVTHTLGDDHMPEFTQCDSGAGKDCMYDINRRYIDKTIRACVLPIGEGTQVGPLNCDSTKGIGTKITGSLEYGATLTANIYGLTGDTKWKANLSAQDGWTNDKAEDRVEIAEGEGGVGTNLSYTIGTRDKALELVPGLMDMGSSRDQQVSLDNQLDDWDWLVAEANGDPLPKDATYFIGKDISFCIDSTELGYEYCVNASEATPLSAKGDAEICTDDTECVTGGAYYPETPDKPLFYSRGIEPIREILIPGSAEGRYLDSLSGTRDDAYYHRPLTITEAKNAKKLKFSEGEFPAPSNDNPLAVFGYKWSVYEHSTEAQSCNLLNSDTKHWYLAVPGLDVLSEGSEVDSLDQEGMLELASSKYSLAALNRSVLGMKRAESGTYKDPDIVPYYSFTTGWITAVNNHHASNASFTSSYIGDFSFVLSDVIFEEEREVLFFYPYSEFINPLCVGQ